MLLGNYSILHKSPAKYLTGTVAYGDRANWNKPGMLRSAGASVGLNWKGASLPAGFDAGGAWFLPRTSGTMVLRARADGGMVLNLLPSKSMEAAFTGSGTLTGDAALAVAMLLALSGTGTLSASIVGQLDAALALTGTGDLAASMTALGNMGAALSGTGGLAALIAAYGDMEIDITVTGTGLSTANVGSAVWGALQAAINSPGTAGAALLAAGSAGDPWSTALPGSYAPGTAGALLSALLNGLTAEQAVQLLEVFQRLGLDPAAPMTTAAGAITFGGESITITEGSGSVTLTRDP